MLDVALKLLKEINEHDYEAYIIGGFVRDYLLGIESNDIDITTNATPKQIREIFTDSCLPNEDYGSVIVMKKNIRFEITTFRKDIGSVDNRKPVEVKYVDDLQTDLLRRDFLINTICMDENENIIDYLNGREDINNRIIRTVGDADKSFNEDALRMLRAIRFATILDFSIDKKTKKYLSKYGYLLKNLSGSRKKEELTKEDYKYLNNVRQISLIKEAKDILLEALNGINNATPVDLVEIDIKRAWEKLGEIIGATYTDELLDQLFSRFCLGK